jgi:hypothetical protein
MKYLETTGTNQNIYKKLRQLKFRNAYFHSVQNVYLLISYLKTPRNIIVPVVSYEYKTWSLAVRE